MHHGEWLALGDLVRVKVPYLERDEILPVVSYITTISDSITSRITLGQSQLTFGDIIKRLG